MTDRINAFQILGSCIANVLFNVRNIDNAVNKGAGAIEIAIHANNFITFSLKHGNKDGANVAKMTGDEYSHIIKSFY